MKRRFCEQVRFDISTEGSFPAYVSERSPNMPVELVREVIRRTILASFKMRVF